ncbi:MAG: hypothetical protein JXQ29_06190 [Planctomycetes bacterium]|nr:hypothetical protein [Planctomycetota bacterium]
MSPVETIRAAARHARQVRRARHRSRLGSRALGVALAALLGGFPPAAAAQEADLALEVLSAHLHPRWLATEVRPDAPDGEDLLGRTETLQLPKPLRRPALLLIYSEEDQVSESAFEQMLFQHPRLVLTARVFKILRLDVRKNPRVAERYRDAIPRFLVYDIQGRRRGDISMAGFRQRPEALLEVMEGVVRDHGSMTIEKFRERYAVLLRDLVPIEAALQQLDKRRAELGRAAGSAHDAERGALEEERKQRLAEKDAWLAREKALLEEYHRKNKPGPAQE